jgi:predicted transposase/invertase (TIGR01784 family)
MSFDNCCKLLAEKYPERFATWLLGQPMSKVEVLKTELTIEPIRADSLILLQTQGQILHIEFQVKLDSDPPLPLRFLDYWVRLYRLYRLPVVQVLVLLRPPSEGTEIESAFVLGTTRHEYRVMKLWEQDPAIFLSDPALLPLATLTATTKPEELLMQIAAEVGKIKAESLRQEISGYVQLMAGLRFKTKLIRQIFREGMMRESAVYQEILEEGRQEGEQKGRQEGRQEGELKVIFRQLTRRVGLLAPAIEAQIRALPLSQLEGLEVALLDFAELSDLNDWLRSQ